MAAATKMSAVCNWCGSSLEVTHTGPCPKCGKQGKTVKVELSETLSVTASLNWERRREFFEINKKVRTVVIAITIISPAFGLIFSGIVGPVVGLAFGILTYILSPYVVTKVREIKQGGSK